MRRSSVRESGGRDAHGPWSKSPPAVSQKSLVFEEGGSSAWQQNPRIGTPVAIRQAGQAYINVRDW